MYQEILEQVKQLAEEEYRTFHAKLIPGTKVEYLGVRVPKLRAVSKQILKDDWRLFLQEAEDSDIYEMIMLYGMVMAGAKCDFAEKLDYVTQFVPQIDNWGVCDIVVGALKDVKKHPEEMYAFLQCYLTSEKEFELRFAIVVLMSYYLNDEYIDRVLEWYGTIKHEGYYVKMAVAWGVSVCFVKYREKTLAFLEAGRLEPWTQNKAIQKIRESYRVSAEDKEFLKRFKA